LATPNVSGSQTPIPPESLLSDDSVEKQQQAAVNSKLFNFERKSSLSRKSSFDSSSSNLVANNTSLFVSTRNFQQQQSQPTNSNNNNNNNNTPNSNTIPLNSTQPTSLDPSQVFLQLFQTAHSYSNENEQPLLIPLSENEGIKRTLNILDYLPCYLTHKIGVVYIGE
jgi:hypothetical protein